MASRESSHTHLPSTPSAAVVPPGAHVVSDDSEALEHAARVASAEPHPHPTDLADLLAPVFTRVNEDTVNKVLVPLGLTVTSMPLYHDTSVGVINPCFFVTATPLGDAADAPATDATEGPHGAAAGTRELVLRIGNPHPMWARVKTESEVAVLSFVRSATSVPVPTVVAHCSDAASSPFGAEYVLMDRLPGEVLHSMCRRIDLSHENRRDVIVQVARYIAEFRQASRAFLAAAHPGVSSAHASDGAAAGGDAAAGADAESDGGAVADAGEEAPAVVPAHGAFTRSMHPTGLSHDGPFTGPYRSWSAMMRDLAAWGADQLERHKLIADEAAGVAPVLLACANAQVDKYDTRFGGGAATAPAGVGDSGGVASAAGDATSAAAAAAAGGATGVDTASASHTPADADLRADAAAGGLVLEHWDLHPGNILATVDDTSGRVVVTGILDWEKSRWSLGDEDWDNMRRFGESFAWADRVRAHPDGEPDDDDDDHLGTPTLAECEALIASVTDGELCKPAGWDERHAIERLVCGSLFCSFSVSTWYGKHAGAGGDEAEVRKSLLRELADLRKEIAKFGFVVPGGDGGGDGGGGGGGGGDGGGDGKAAGAEGTSVAATPAAAVAVAVAAAVAGVSADIAAPGGDVIGAPAVPVNSDAGRSRRDMGAPAAAVATAPGAA